MESDLKAASINVEAAKGKASAISALTNGWGSIYGSLLGQQQNDFSALLQASVSWATSQLNYTLEAQKNAQTYDVADRQVSIAESAEQRARRLLWNQEQRDMFFKGAVMHQQEVSDMDWRKAM